MVKLTQYTIHRYEIPLIAPLHLATQTLTARSGYLLELRDEEGHCGYGEASPLLGFSSETEEQVLESLADLKPRLLNSTIAMELSSLDGGFCHWLGPSQLPSVQMAVEMAVLQIIAENNRWQTLLPMIRRQRIAVNGLLTGSTDEFAEQLARQKKSGVTTLKLKVGRHSLERDIARVEVASRHLDTQVALRLDANRAWSFDEAVTFAKAIASCRVEYIEEPVADPTALGQWHLYTDIPLALDETLREWAIERSLALAGVAAWVVKPTLYGGLEKTMQLARLAEKNGIDMVISSSFESGLGLATLAGLAACINDRDVAAGLDTYRWLQQDTLAERLAIAEGKIDVARAYAVSRRLACKGNRLVT